MNKHLKTNERELVKVATFFKRQSKKLIDAGKLGEEHRQVEEAVDRFLGQMDEHANIRVSILEQRKFLSTMVKDNAECPRCHTKDMIKAVGVEKNEKGWKSNRYKCRKCNIQFTWNRPNNPWDTISYIQEVITMFQLKYNTAVSDEERGEINASIESLQANIEKIKPIIDRHDEEYNALLNRDLEMEKLIHEFKNTLLIEKIKMDTWESKSKS